LWKKSLGALIRNKKMLAQPIGVSCLICTYNGASRIAETLGCLARQTVLANTAWEVILVDNASTDDTAKQAQRQWEALGAPAPLYLLRESKPGKQHALETAIEQVRYRYTCIVDDDNRLAADYLRVGLDILEANPQAGILGGPNTATFEGAEPAWFTSFQHCYAVGPQLDRVGGRFLPLTDGDIGRNVLWGAGMFVRTAIWHKLRSIGFQSMFSGRLLESNLTAGEDDELCYIAQLLGYEVWYSSRLHLQHHMVASRLTETYRDRLFYASTRSATRLNAYRNALWGKEEAAVGINLVKDIGYNALGVAKSLFSRSFVQAMFSSNSVERMNQWHSLLVMKEAIAHFRQVKSYYNQVLQLKQQVGNTSPSESAV
jgi:glycosyltransferase involved in cell wall biosynthesis